MAILSYLLSLAKARHRGNPSNACSYIINIYVVICILYKYMDVFYTYITIDVSMNARRFVKVWMIQLVIIFPKQHTDNAKSLQFLGGFWPCPLPTGYCWNSGVTE